VWPVFILDREGAVFEEIPSMPGCQRQSLDQLFRELEELMPLGLRSLALFPCISEDQKTKNCEEAFNPDGFLPRALKEIKKHFPELVIFSDVALDPYSIDGHDGLVRDGQILNDETLEVLGKQALMQAKAGADFVAPSDMMDGRVGYIRSLLDQEGYMDVGIMAYCAKYASSFYGPFRDALDSAPRFGDKKTYQMNPQNKKEALRELELDMSEGADILMVKPALSYLDVIQSFSENTHLPVAAYNVSGEYSLIKAASEKGWIDEKKCVLEVLTSIKRSGAKIIFSYHTPDILKWLEK
jgi:porphobilinogen synthase